MPTYPHLFELMRRLIGKIRVTKVALLLFAQCFAGFSLFAISEGNVLVIYNSTNADSQAVHDYYTGMRPGVLSFDLNDASLNPGTISYANFNTGIRQPIKNHLNGNNLEATVQVIVLTKGIPHRIQSISNTDPNVGDNAGATTIDYNDGGANFASVDSELTLLQFDLSEDELGGSMDSVADQAVTNPYFNQTARFSSFSRAQITSSNRSFSEQGPYGWWRLLRKIGIWINLPADAGHIYLTARLDATTVQEVKDIIDRAQNIVFRSDVDALLFDSSVRAVPFDRYSDPFTGQPVDDYSEAESALSGDWPQLLFDNTSTFIVGNSGSIAYTPTTVITGPIAHLHSYGVNHSGSGSQQRDYLATFTGQLVPGASFSAYESFGARGLAGLGNNGQAQVEEWITAGGTFATGPVWEPFTFGILKSEIFLDRFMNQGFTYVEAAWASILQLSWQTVVIGDPLATATVTTASPYTKWSFEETGRTADIDSTLTPDSDFDADGIPNAIEYTLGLTPTISDTDSDRLPNFQFSSNSQTVSFTLEAAHIVNATLTLETSTTLQANSWTTIATKTAGANWSGTASVSETDNGATLDVVATDPSTNMGKRFYRLSAELTGE
jgi:hypothetical protein